jgi:cation transport ATPase
MFVDEEVCPMNFFHALVATLEANSDHPLAYAITNNSKEVSNMFGSSHFRFEFSLCEIWSREFKEHCML